MTLRTRLTLWSVLLMALVVGIIGAIDLGAEIQQQFENTLERADLVKTVATHLVIETLERHRNAPLRDALRDPNLGKGLVDSFSRARSLLEIVVTDKDNEILAGTDANRIGVTYTVYDNFAPVVTQASWAAKFRILYSGRRYFQLEQPLGTDGQPLLYVRVVVFPALIRETIMPTLRENALIALASIGGAVLVTLLFSTFAFRPLGRLGHMLDLIAKGEYELPPEPPPAKPATDELSVMASKVSLLGQQLRGARYEFSDLRGNLERLLDELEDAVFIFGRDRRLVVASGAVEKFLGRTRSDLIGQALFDVFPANSTLGLMLAQAAQTGRRLRNRRVPIPVDAGAARVPYLLLSVDLLDSPAKDGSPSGLLVRLRDPEATQQISRRLQMADRLTAISGITSGVAHEVKNPLNAILMHVELARMKLAQGDHELDPHMETISREILRLDRVVKTFLDFTRPVELSLSEVPLEEFVSEIMELARPQAAMGGIQIEARQEAEGAEIRVDRDLMKQALLNIVMNAIEAMPHGGRLTFQSAVREEQGEIRIADTGTGIPPEVRDQIFRLYFTTKKEGSGIGLAMTFRVVQLHDGTIEFSSEPGKGTTFCVRLPLVG